MGMKVATACFHWSQSSVPHPPPSSQALASAILSPSSKRRTISDGALLCQYFHRLDQSALFGTPSSILYRSRSCEHPKSRTQRIKRACSASLDAFSDEEFSKQIQELALRFQLSEDDVENKNNGVVEAEPERIVDSMDRQIKSSGESSKGSISFVENQKFSSPKLEPVQPPDWAGRDEIIPASIERKANSVDLPISLRMIKRKKQWQEGFREAGESAYSSVIKAFSSMVFIIRELQSYTWQMREILFYEDLQGILGRVQTEMNASFVCVYSIASSAAVATTLPPQAYAAMTESVSMIEDQKQQKFDSSAVKTFSVSSSGRKTASIGGNNGGGGGKFKPVASGTDGDGRFDGSIYREYHQTVIPDIGTSRTSEEESVSGQVTREEELRLWNSVVEEASKMQTAIRDEALDHDTTQRFVSPICAEIEADDYSDYLRTELLYQTGLVQEPDNPLLLSNYAQFLYLVAHDYDRAEDYFKRAVKVDPKDAEALNKYASFLWQVRKDLWGAEETYLEAISADPSNSYYAANYAHFLWSTGGEDTCFPLSSPDTTDA
ncbi:unnamed protein product [Ilex paraguariensis]|uniref:Tetratricopeptide repeat-like superfamily protein n=1 Tax=Ilex paraguariensis TaxID=185542 RepID=A0ABC8R1D3_9AQUA